MSVGSLRGRLRPVWSRDPEGQTEVLQLNPVARNDARAFPCCKLEAGHTRKRGVKVEGAVLRSDQDLVRSETATCF